MASVDLRESPAGSGCSEITKKREETPGGDAKGNSMACCYRDVVGAPLKMDQRDSCVEEDSASHHKSINETKQEDELDPRIQEELERLNASSEEINKLELELNDSRSNYRKVLSDSAKQLNTLSSQLGTCIQKARPYYEARRQAKEAQQETQRAALTYERAVSMHAAAREMVHVAEQGLMAAKNVMDLTWHEMLNHATIKVNEAEDERHQSEQEHMRVSLRCQKAEAHMQGLQKSLKRAIVKSKPYFELKAQLNNILEEHKTKVLGLEEHVTEAKTCYSDALRNLEQISEQIHAQRGLDQAGNGPVTPSGGRSSPIGAEANGGAEDEARLINWTAGQERITKTTEWVERHRESSWGEEEKETAAQAERSGSDSLSVFSLQTIASDLEKCDSVEHLGQLSDVVSLSGEEGETDERKGGVRLSRDKRVDDRLEQFDKQHHRSVSL